MKYTMIQGIDKKASRLVYGSVAPVSNGNIREAFEALNAAWDAGFTIFDTAHAYGKSEDTIGKWMAERNNRDEVILMDKGFNPGENGSPDVYSAQTIRSQIEESLERLQTDYLDMYVLHRDDPRFPVEEIVDVLNEYKRKGVIKKFGGSNWSLQRLIAVQEYALQSGQEAFSVCSPGYNVVSLVRDPWGGSVTLTGKDNWEFREWLISNQMPVIHYSALGRGYVSGKYNPDGGIGIELVLPFGPVAEYDCEENRNVLRRLFAVSRKKGCTVAQLALACVLHSKMNTFPIVAPKGRHIQEVIGSFDVELTDEEIREIVGY